MPYGCRRVPLATDPSRAAGILAWMPPRVLLVDDDPAIMRLLEVNFRISGFEIETATRGDDAVRRATSSPPDAIVMDVMMPGLDGYDVCRLLREEPSLARTPVVFLTARPPDESDRIEELGPVDQVAKPFDPAGLVELVRTRIGEAAG
jgi:two-component system alkaline phosphatase synthesis response regulator PhoP